MPNNGIMSSLDARIRTFFFAISFVKLKCHGMKKLICYVLVHKYLPVYFFFYNSVLVALIYELVSYECGWNGFVIVSLNLYTVVAAIRRLIVVNQ